MGGNRVFDGIMQQGGDNGIAVHLHISQNRGDFQRMGKIRVPTGPGLLAMDLHGEDISPVQHIFIGVRVIFPDTFHKFILPDHPTASTSKDESNYFITLYIAGI